MASYKHNRKTWLWRHHKGRSCEREKPTKVHLSLSQIPSPWSTSLLPGARIGRNTKSLWIPALPSSIKMSLAKLSLRRRPLRPCWSSSRRQVNIRKPQVFPQLPCGNSLECCLFCLISKSRKFSGGPGLIRDATSHYFLARISGEPLSFSVNSRRLGRCLQVNQLHGNNGRTRRYLQPSTF